MFSDREGDRQGQRSGESAPASKIDGKGSVSILNSSRCDSRRPLYWKPMPGKRRALLWLLAVGSLVAGAPRFAHAQGVGLEVNGGYYRYGGTIGSGADDGFGIEAVGDYGWRNGFGFGLGVGVDFRNVDPSPIGGDTGAESRGLQIFAQPSFRFGPSKPAKPSVHPFVAARIGYARLSFRAGNRTTFLERSRRGFSAGAIGGVELWLAEGMAITGSLLFGVLELGDGTVSGETVPMTDSSGTRLGFRGGLKIRVP